MAGARCGHKEEVFAIVYCGNGANARRSESIGPHHGEKQAAAFHLAVSGRRARSLPRRARGPQRREEPIMPEISIENPDALGKPLGQYSQITRVKASELLFIAGQVATDRGGKLVGADDFDAQCRQVFANIEAALKSQGASFANVVEFTTYLVHSQDIAKFMAYRLREFPRLFANGVYPPNTLLIVDRLVQEPFLIEVRTIAAL
jgi:enamine deaminase RidA (YjgF/YER057c/UK114 family)